jgi:hypothetical protein
VLALCAGPDVDHLLGRAPTGWQAVRLSPGLGVRVE